MRVVSKSLIAALLAGTACGAPTAGATDPQPQFHALAMPARGTTFLPAREEPTPAPVATEVRATLAADGRVRTWCEVVVNPAFEAWQRRRAAARLAEPTR